MKKMIMILFCLIIFSSYSFASVKTIDISDLPVIEDCGVTSTSIISEGTYRYLLSNDCLEVKLTKDLQEIKIIKPGKETYYFLSFKSLIETDDNGFFDEFSMNNNEHDVIVNDQNIHFYLNKVNEPNYEVFFTLNDNKLKYGLIINDYAFSYDDSIISLKTHFKIYNPSDDEKGYLIKDNKGQEKKWVDYDLIDDQNVIDEALLDDSKESKFFSSDLINNIIEFNDPLNDGVVYDSNIVFQQKKYGVDIIQSLGRGNNIYLDPTIYIDNGYYRSGKHQIIKVSNSYWTSYTTFDVNNNYVTTIARTTDNGDSWDIVDVWNTNGTSVVSSTITEANNYLYLIDEDTQTNEVIIHWCNSNCTNPSNWDMNVLFIDNNINQDYIGTLELISSGNDLYFFGSKKFMHCYQDIGSSKYCTNENQWDANFILYDGSYAYDKELTTGAGSDLFFAYIDENQDIQFKQCVGGTGCETEGKWSSQTKLNDITKPFDGLKLEASPDGSIIALIARESTNGTGFYFTQCNAGLLDDCNDASNWTNMVHIDTVSGSGDIRTFDIGLTNNNNFFVVNDMPNKVIKSECNHDCNSVSNWVISDFDDTSNSNAEIEVFEDISAFKFVRWRDNSPSSGMYWYREQSDFNAPELANPVPLTDVVNESDTTPTFTIDVTDDISGVLDCNATIYRNDVLWDVNSGIVPVASVCSYTLPDSNALSDGETMKVSWIARDNSGNWSSDVNTGTYTYSVPAPPSGGGGGGGVSPELLAQLLNVEEKLTVTTALAEITVSSFVLNLDVNETKSYYVIITNNTPGVLPIDVVPDESIQNYLIPIQENALPTVLEEGESKRFDYVVRVNHDFNVIDSNVLINLNNGQQLINRKLLLQKTKESFLTKPLIKLPQSIPLIGDSITIVHLIGFAALFYFITRFTGRGLL